MKKMRKLELVMGILLLGAAYVLSREGARLASTSGTKNLVILDAGHGGDDPGKIGYNGVREKDVNLAITLQLKKRLEEAGVSVELTRADENGFYDSASVNAKVVDLQKRVEMIHEKQPSCVISIHQNSYPDPSVKGAQVFYYADSKEGEKLAGIMQQALAKGLDPDNHRKSKGNTTYYLLKKTDAVMVICECGFLSNPKEAELLNTKKYQEKVADALCSGILEYLNG